MDVNTATKAAAKPTDAQKLHVKLRHFPANAAAWVSIHKFILALSLVLFCILLGAGVAICMVYTNDQQEEIRDEALGLAKETGEFFSGQLDQAILPLFSMAQFAVELPIFRSLPDEIGPFGEEGSLPFAPPRRPGDPFTHRNVTGVCDEPALVARFTEIASTIKKHAKMEGILVNLQLAPQAVVCLLHPLINTEDFEDGIIMDNTGAQGLDLLVDPFSKFIAEQSIPKDDVIVAGPLTLRQCSGQSCHATVEKAFIARLPIGVPDHEITVDGIPYNKWGFATALINWEALITRSNVFDNFAARNMEFQLTRTDRQYNSESGELEDNVVILAETPGYAEHAEDCPDKVMTALQTTNNEWEISVIYDLGPSKRTYTAILFVSFLVSACISGLTFIVLSQRQTQSEMKAQTFAQDAKVETERNMTAYFAHELRNPLGAIDSALVAMPDDLAESTKDLITGMQLCTTFMSSIMNNLLDVRKMEEGKMTLHPQPTSLKRLVESVHSMLLPSVKKNVDFLVVCESEGRDWVLADLHRIQQVMTNVVTNAIKYTIRGSISLCIGWEEDMVIFQCIDTGPGIPKDQQEKMFERFVQRGGAPGSGLGLAISKHIVNLIGGDIRFESDPIVKPGTNCIVRLKLPQCDQPTEKILNAANLRELEPLQEAISILIIDDIRMNRMMLKRRIHKGIAPNCTITEASTGEEALEICKDEQFDIIVVDQYMEEAGGKIPGTDVVVEMRRMKITSLIIGSSGNELDGQFREAGADFVWQKPIPSNDKIIPQLRHALANRKVDR